MRNVRDQFIFASDLFLLEDSPLSPTAQREQIFAEFVTLGVNGQQPYKDQRAQRGYQASNLTPEERELLDRVCQPAERFSTDFAVPWLRTCYEPSTEAAFSTIVSRLEYQFGGEVPILNDPVLYDFGADWQKIFLRIPQLLEYSGSAEGYNESLQEALREKSEAEASDVDDGYESDGYESEHDYTMYHWALVVGRIHIVDRITLASDGRNAGKVLIVFYDECGRVIRSYRESVCDAANITSVDNYILDEHACWANGKIGKEYRWGEPLGPPYGEESEQDGDDDEGEDEDE